MQKSRSKEKRAKGRKSAGSAAAGEPPMPQRILGSGMESRPAVPSSALNDQSGSQEQCDCIHIPIHHGDFLSTTTFFSSELIWLKRSLSCPVLANGTSVAAILYSRLYFKTFPAASVLLLYSANGNAALVGSGRPYTWKPSGTAISTMSVLTNGAGKSYA